MRSYESLKTVEKTLLVLEELNRHATCRVSELKAATGIPAPSLVRILETLVSIGYVRQMSRMSGYCLTERVQALASGYHGLPEVFEGAREAADAFTRDMLWPASIATFDVDAMVVRYSTIPASPLSHKQSTINRRLDMLTRAHGRAYLAFCAEAERRHVLHVLVRSGFYAGGLDALETEIEPVLAAARRLGVARRDPQIEAETTTLALPLWVGDRLVATLGTTFFRASVRDQGAIIQRLRAAGEQVRAWGAAPRPPALDRLQA